ncbi:hypothetical protein [Micromonospora echinofusca]|uniref:Uncharacterized protein n=1 Tax=Micromonospora echinofusca TaxID=47858 RepID=A0ABS3VQH7_MICEH|nr:hypothetical protein [Micromonospora echinofusca]MBO4206760.1 hypothetical protein [Micromonospora echinofusca]
MSESRHDHDRRPADRPDGVTDPLLWRLALDVADAHAPDGDGGCHNLLCADQPWPCPAWQSAQRALQVAQAPQARSDRRDDRPGADSDWPGGPVTRRLRPAVPPEQAHRGQDRAASAA